jgi:outer membrane receptor protein involved in Fe transport
MTRMSGSPAVRGYAAVSVADEVRLWRGRLALTPAVRLDGIISSQVVDERGDPVPGKTRGDAFISPRLTVRLTAPSWLTVRASGGRFVRFPTLIEQFGDGAFILGSRYVVPESAWGGDAGAGVDLRRRRLALAIEGAFFGRHVENYIAFLPSAYGIAAANIGQSRALGAELRVDARVVGWLRATLDYTFLDTFNMSTESGTLGKQLPNRPRHHLVARVELTVKQLLFYYELDYTDDVYRDAQNYNRLPARLLQSIGMALRVPPFRFSLDVRNLADLRVVQLPLGGTAHAGETTPYPLVDYFDYPLPGRALFATLAFDS